MDNTLEQEMKDADKIARKMQKYVAIKINKMLTGKTNFTGCLSYEALASMILCTALYLNRRHDIKDQDGMIDNIVSHAKEFLDTHYEIMRASYDERQKAH